MCAYIFRAPPPPPVESLNMVLTKTPASFEPFTWEMKDKERKLKSVRLT